MKEKRTSAAEAGCNGNTYGTGEITPASKEHLLGTPITRALNETISFQHPLSTPELYLATAARILSHTQHESTELTHHTQHESDW
jgi:hypothetical protein